MPRLKPRPTDLPEVDRTGKTCRKHGHDVREWAVFGWCHRCEHSVHGASGKVLYYGEFHRKVPPHDEAAEARTAAWAKGFVERSMDPNADHEALRSERRKALGFTT